MGSGQKRQRAGRKGLQKANGLKPSGKLDEQTRRKGCCPEAYTGKHEGDKRIKELVFEFFGAGANRSAPAFFSLLRSTWFSKPSPDERADAGNLAKRYLSSS